MEFILILLIYDTAAFRWFLLLPDFVFCQSGVKDLAENFQTF